jgi:hypothetical protein
MGNRPEDLVRNVHEEEEESKLISNWAERHRFVTSGDFRFISLFTRLRNAMESLPNEYRVLFRADKLAEASGLRCKTTHRTDTGCRANFEKSIHIDQFYHTLH